jgi:hypothetical protein
MGEDARRPGEAVQTVVRGKSAAEAPSAEMKSMAAKVPFRQISETELGMSLRSRREEVAYSG